MGRNHSKQILNSIKSLTIDHSCWLLRPPSWFRAFSCGPSGSWPPGYFSDKLHSWKSGTCRAWDSRQMSQTNVHTATMIYSIQSLLISYYFNKCWWFFLFINTCWSIKYNFLLLIFHKYFWIGISNTVIFPNTEHLF